jgi:ankyrin repeat protein
LETYVASHLRIEDPTLIEELLGKASGVFLWVVLAVDTLNREYQRGGLSLRKRLTDIPSDLTEMLRDILTRDNESVEALLLCILWILCAKRPLQPTEFYHALSSGLSLKGLVDDQIPDVTGPDTIKKFDPFVISSSRGLAEVSKTKQPTVQFIHESVREFLIGDKKLYDLWPDIGVDWEGTSHEILKQCCNFYMNHSLVCASVSKLLFESKSNARTEILKVYPLLEYASQHILYHANAAAKVVPQDEFLSSFPISNWITINNLFEKFKACEYSPDTNLFYILAEQGFSELIRTRLKADPECHVLGGRYRYPLFAALANGNKDTVAALLNLPSSIYNGVDITEGLKFRKDSKNYENRTPLSWAAQDGRTEIVKLLLQTRTTVNDVDWEGRTPLSRASENGHEAVVELLIDKGADVNASDNNGWTPLLWASHNGHEKVVRLLIIEGADVDNVKITEAVVIAAASNGSDGRAVLQLLLDRRGDDVKITEAVVIAAASNGSDGRAVLQLLLDRRGDDVKITEAVVIAAASNGSDGRAVLQLLLDRRGHEVKVTDNILRAAAANFSNRDALIRLLSDRRENDIKITDDIVQAGAVNELKGGLGPQTDGNSTQIFSSAGTGPAVLTEGTSFFHGSWAPENSKYVSDQVLSAEQRSTLNTQTAPLSEVEDLQTVYSDTFTMNVSVKEIYILELVRELLKHFSPFRIDSSSMRRVKDAMPDCLKAFSLRLGSSEFSQHVHRDVTAFIRKYRQ